MSEPYQGNILLNVSLADYTTWRVGGIAKRMYQPTGIEDLASFLQHCPETEPLLWLGLGSNTLLKDTGFSGTVILTQGCLNGLQALGNNQIRVEAGVSCAKMARFCARNGLAGAEFWAGIPGTMGGALRMNAGCFNAETWQYVISVETMDRYGKTRVRSPQEFEISYRHVDGLANNEWFIAATCAFPLGDKETSLKLIKELLAHRAATQPTSEYNCGSVFRNPPGHFAAQLIEKCGLKGKRLGGANISMKHANFILNDQGQALAKDIESLIVLTQNDVRQKTGIELVPEVHILGDA